MIKNCMNLPAFRRCRHSTGGFALPGAASLTADVRKPEN